MTKIKGTLATINDYVLQGKAQQIIYRRTQDAFYNGRHININNKQLIHFGNCSYLGLETDKRLIDSVAAYTQKFGTQFSSSRSFLQPTPLDEYEELLQEIFGHPVVTYTSVSIGHHAVIPVLIRQGDAIIMDQQVHASVQDAAKKLLVEGVHIEFVQHNRLDLLENRIQTLANKFNKIWYLADSIYSMYGDFTPVQQLTSLLNNYPKFHLYIDDAHGMSIAGKHGAGMFSRLCGNTIHPKTVIATSLNKAFASGGGAFIIPNPEQQELITHCSGAYIFSGPLQIGSIGAGIASAKIHLSEEIYTLQADLQTRLRFCNELLIEAQLPVVSNPESPIFFIGVGLVSTAFDLTRRLQQDGCFVNPAIFPAVPDQSAGIRFTITRHHSFQDIQYLVERIAFHLPKSFQYLGRSKKDIVRGFRKIQSFDQLINGIPEQINRVGEFSLQHETTIDKISKEAWNQSIGSLGVNNWEQLQFFEQLFSNNDKPEHNWKFHYFIIRDKQHNIILATYFTEVISKDDMFAPANVSEQLEAIRKDINDPYYLSSKMLTMGCLLSVGKHIYMDYSKDWKKAFTLLLDEVQGIRDDKEIEVLSLRDFKAKDQLLKQFLIEMGYKPIEIPDNHILPYKNWKTEKEFLDLLPGKSSKSRTSKRYYVRKRAIELSHLYEVKWIENTDGEIANQLERLYQNVSEKSFEINGFRLPSNFFSEVIKNPNWEVMGLFIKGQIDSSPVGMAISYKSDLLYNFLVTGMDYDYLDSHQVYAQTLWQVVQRANELGLPLSMGITASQPKRKFGAETINNVIYYQHKNGLKEKQISLVANQVIA